MTACTCRVPVLRMEMRFWLEIFLNSFEGRLHMQRILTRGACSKMINNAINISGALVHNAQRVTQRGASALLLCVCNGGCFHLSADGKKARAPTCLVCEQTGANLCSLQLYQGPGARTFEIAAHFHMHKSANIGAARALTLHIGAVVWAIILMTTRAPLSRSMFANDVIASHIQISAACSWLNMQEFFL
jgi:hypothetical protein